MGGTDHGCQPDGELKPAISPLPDELVDETILIALPLYSDASRIASLMLSVYSWYGAAHEGRRFQVPGRMTCRT